MGDMKNVYRIVVGKLGRESNFRELGTETGSWRLFPRAQDTAHVHDDVLKSPPEDLTASQLVNT